LRKKASEKAGADEPSARRHGPIDTAIKAPGIILIGFMGAGKSSVGRRLADHVGWTFEDLDQRIEARERRKVHEIFRESGEAGFRMAERAALQELLSEVQAGARKVVALGGGAFVQKENSELIEETGFVTVFLDADVNELWRRCCEQADREQIGRPLLRSLSGFRELYQARRRHYARAMFHKATDGKTVDEIAEELAKVLELSFKGPRQKNSRRRKRGEKN
jgi:shikimate kinase